MKSLEHLVRSADGLGADLGSMCLVAPAAMFDLSGVTR